MMHRKPRAVVAGAALLAVVAGAALFTLAACGGSGDSSNNRSADRTFTNAAEVTKDANRQGPAADIEGAKAGGTITVYLPGDPGPDSMDPTDGWSVTGNSIQQALTNRSLTQYARDAEDRRDGPGPRPGDRPGHAQRRLHRVDVHDP